MPQNSSVSLEKKLTGDNRISVKNRVPAKVPLTEINEYLVCQLCFGYLIEATAITECQHTFCKSCILNYLERKNNYCPICEVQLNEAQPHLSLRSDDVLQKLVYKLVPGLLVAEVHRRKEHIGKSGSIPPDGTLNGEGCGGIALLSADVKEAQDFCFLSPNDPVSLSLEYFKSTTVDEDSKSKQLSKHSATTPVPTAAGTTGATAACTTATETSPQKKNICSDKANDRRYLQCPAAVSVGLLKKFIRMKYGLSDHYRVDLLYNGDGEKNMENDLTLLDLSFIFKWKKAEPMCFHYRIFDRPVLKTGLVRPGTKRSSPPSILNDDDKPEDDDDEGGSGARSSVLPSGPSTSKLTRFGDNSSSSSNTTSSGTSTKNSTGKGQGKKSNGSVEEPTDPVTVSSTPRGRRISTTGKESPISQVFEVKETQNCTSQFNLRITTSPFGSSMTSKLSPSSSSSSCSSASSPPSPLKISLPVKGIAEGKSSHHRHHRHHHHHRKDKKRRRSGKSKDKDRDKGRERDRDKDRYKYNAHPNPSQSRTISVKPGRHGKRSSVGVIGKSETGNSVSGKEKDKGKEKLKASSGTTYSDVGTIANKGTVVNGGGKNAAAGILGLTRRLSISGTFSRTPPTVNVKANNSISVSKVVERRGPGSSTHVLTFNANSGVKSGPGVASTSEQRRRPGRPPSASKVAAVAATVDRLQGGASPTARAVHIPDSVHLQVPKSVTLIPVNPPGAAGSTNGGKLTPSRLSNEKSSGRVSAAGNPHTFTHPITNKSLHQITVTEVPPPSAKSGGPSSEISSGYSGSSGSSGNSSTGNQGIKSIEKSIQSLSHRQFNGPGSMEITKIYCDSTTPKSSSATQSNCSKVFEVQGGKKLKGLDISISPSPTGGVNSSTSVKSGGLVQNDSVSVTTTTTQKLSISLSKALPKIPGVSILPQSNPIGKSGQHVKVFGSGGSHPSLMSSLNLKMNERHSNQRISQQPQQGGRKNPISLSLPGDNSPYRTGSEKSSFNSCSGERPPPRKEIGEMSSTAPVTRTPSPPSQHPQHQNPSKPTFSPVPVKAKIKRPFQFATSPRKNNSEGAGDRASPADSGPSERKRVKMNSGVDSPLDLSGKSSRSSPSPAASGDGHTKGQSPTHSSCDKIGKGKFASDSGASGSQQQGHGHGGSSKTGQSENNKSQSQQVHTQTILTTAQNLAQKQHQHNAESQQRQRVMMRSKSMNGSTGAGGQSIRQGGSPPIRNPMAGVTGTSDPLGNLMTLSNAAARVKKMDGNGGAAGHSINSLVASPAGFYPPMGQPSPQGPPTHVLAQHFANHHHHMNMNLMSPPQLKPENQTPSFFSNFTPGAVGGKAIAVSSNSLSPPLANPLLPTTTSTLSPSASLRIPTTLSKLSPVSKSRLLFPTLSVSSGKNRMNVHNPGTLSTKVSGHSTSSPSLGLIRPTILNGALTPNPHPHTHTFLAPSSIPPTTQSSSSSSSVKNAIPNSMKISNFLPATKSTTVSANTNAMITSGRSLAKYLNSIPPTPTIEISANSNSSLRPSIPFAIESIKSNGSGKVIVSSDESGTGSTSTTLVSTVSASAYKLTSLSNSVLSEQPAGTGGESGANLGSANEGFSALGAALGLYPREPAVAQAHTCQQQSGQQNQGVRHIPNPSQIFACRQNSHSSTDFAKSNNITKTTKSDDENGLKLKSSAVVQCRENNPSSPLVVATPESLNVIKPPKLGPLAAMPLELLLPSPSQSSLSSSVESPSAMVKETKDVLQVLSLEEKEEREEKDPKREGLGEENDASLVLIPSSPHPQGMEEIKSENCQKPPRGDGEEKLVEMDVSLTSGRSLEGTTKIHSELEAEIPLVAVPLPQVKLYQVIPAGDGAIPAQIGESSSCTTSEMRESEIISSSTSTPGDNNLKVDEEEAGEMDHDDSQEEVMTEDDDEGTTQLSLEKVVAQVENNRNGLTGEVLYISSEISTSENGGKSVDIGSAIVESLQQSRKCSDPFSSKVKLESQQGIKESGPNEISIAPVTVTAVNNVSAPAALGLNPILQIKVEPVEKLNTVPLIETHLAKEPVEMIHISVSPTSSPGERPIPSKALEINTNTNNPDLPLPPRSLLIASPILVSLSERSRSNSPSQQGHNSPGSGTGDKKVDLRKMENLEKVAAGLLASAANSNNNNVIVTTSGVCDLGSSLTSPPPSNPSNIAVAPRSTPPPITITNV